GFAEGVELNDGVCKDAKLTILGEKTAEVTLREGRYHQIKRMFGCYGAKVVELHRIAMGELYLPDDLPEGECRELTEEDLQKLQTREK
ncbi:MAG: 16S rRNA pseudouridine(516) synthase, partial [Anaerotignum sp.]|nr:16S rRNA pseudouridine(516) synthase [Anaerotignum sp.]